MRVISILDRRSSWSLRTMFSISAEAPGPDAGAFCRPEGLEKETSTGPVRIWPSVLEHW